jgi:hypothetical protein
MEADGIVGSRLWFRRFCIRPTWDALLEMVVASEGPFPQMHIIPHQYV